MKTVHYIPHTHWDREWYRSSDAFRLRLVYSLDLLLNTLINDPDFSCYTLDGQTCIIEEYLEIRPERRSDIEHLVTTCRLLIGPWYTQPDLFLASGESILRNLVIGTKFAEKLGGVMNVGWIPDAFGQIQSTPQIFSALGMEAIFVWRGFNYRQLEDSAFIWEAPNGEKLLSIHFPLGYGHYRYLPEEAEQAKRDVEEVISKLEPRFHDNQLLFMGGSDHARIQPDVPARLKMLNAALADQYHFEISNPLHFITALKKEWALNPRRLDLYRGEARSADLGRIHAGISSTNIDYKNTLKYYETMLARITEPFSILSHTLGGSFDQSLSNYFWKLIFRNQFHDTAYQSSPETVNQSGYNRLLKLRHGINELNWLNFRFLGSQLNLSELSKDDDIIIAFNPLPRRRKDNFRVNLFVKNTCFTLFNEKGEVIPYEVLREPTKINNEIEYYNGLLNLNDTAEVREGTMAQVQIIIDGNILPELGYQVMRVAYGHASTLHSASTLWVDGYRFGNDKLEVEIHPDGSLSVLHCESGEKYKDLLIFEDRGDDGDEYNYSPPREDKLITSAGTPALIRQVESNALQVMFEMTHCLNIPRTCENSKRVDETTQLYIRTTITLEKNAELLKFYTEIDNVADNHRLRVYFKGNNRCSSSLSEDHFGSIVRSNQIIDGAKLEEGATEVELPIYPSQRFVTLSDTHHTMALISSGTCEYEIVDDEIIAMTLLRATGMFGKADLAVRPGRASGYRLETPSSQCHRKITHDYAVTFSAGKPDVKSLSFAADELSVTVQSRHLKTLQRDVNQGLDWRYSLFSLENMELLALKRTEQNDNYYIIRLLNRDTAPALQQLPKKGRWFNCSLREEIGSEIENNTVTVAGQSFLTLAWLAV